MNESAQELMIRKNYFYRDNFRRLVTYIILLLLLAVCLAITLAYLTWQKKLPKYYASTTTGEVIELHSLSQPVISNAHLLEWAGLVARQAYSFSFLNYQQQLDKAKPFFTPSAWQNFTAELNSSGLLDQIKNEKIIMETIVYATPDILFSGVLHGRYTWRIQVPVLVTYTTASEQKENKITITMDIARVPVLDTPEGIQVVSFTVNQ